MTQEINFDVIRELIRVSKAMEESRLVNTYEGNLSVLADGLMYITPTSTRKRDLTEELIAVLDGEGNQIYGERRPSSEKTMHAGAYRLRSDIGAVIHCHATYLTAYAMCQIPLDAKCHPEMLMFFRDIPVAPYGRPGTADIFDHAAPLLKERNIVLLGNHGVLAVGSTLEKAFARVEAAEKFAQTLTIAKSLGPTVRLPEEDIAFLSALPITV